MVQNNNHPLSIYKVIVMNYKGIKDKVCKCLNCGTEMPFKGYVDSKYCNNKCQREYQFKTETLIRFESGEIKDRGTLRKVLTKTKGYKCVSCNIEGWNSKPITLQVNHIDGNCTNNIPNNLELICPNCHSQTDTFGARNKGNGRKSRGLPLYY